MQQQLLTLKDLSAALNCSRTTVWRKIKAGEIPAPVIVCGLTRWKPQQIETLIEGAPVPVIPHPVRKRKRIAA